MARQIGISRHGFARCPDCGQHIRVAPRVETTLCPFCDTALVQRVERESLLDSVLDSTRAFLGGRGGLIAASLLGVAPVTMGCEKATTTASGGDAGVVSDGGGTGGKADTTTGGITGDVVPQPVYGLPADITAPDTQPIPDTGPQPMYGGPPDDIVTTVDVDDDIPPQPLYGIIPADVLPAQDVEPTPDIPIQPLYGLPAPIDATESIDADEDTTDTGKDNTPVPLYGLPPNPPK